MARLERHAECILGFMIHALLLQASMLRRRYRIEHRAFARRCLVHDLTPARFQLLHVLWSSAGFELGQAALTRAMGVSPAVVTRLVQALVRLGLVERIPCPTDKRVRTIRLSPEGVQRVRVADADLARPARDGDVEPSRERATQSHLN